MRGHSRPSPGNSGSTLPYEQGYPCVEMETKLWCPETYKPTPLHSCMFTWRRRMCRSCRPKQHPPCERSLSINKWACWVFTAVLRASLMEHSPCEIDTLSTCWQHPASKPAGPLGRPCTMAVLPTAFQEAWQEQASCTLPPSAQLQPWRLYF